MVAAAPRESGTPRNYERLRLSPRRRALKMFEVAESLLTFQSSFMYTDVVIEGTVGSKHAQEYSRAVVSHTFHSRYATAEAKT